MARWVRVGTLQECPPGTAREVVAEDRVVALFNVDGTIHALDGICPHQGGPLGKGTLQGTVVTCPWHGWQFDVCTGQHQVNANLHHLRLAVRIEADEIWVDING